MEVWLGVRGDTISSTDVDEGRLIKGVRSKDGPCGFV